MIQYIFKKLGHILLTLFGVVTIVFFLFNVIPGDPARMMLGQNENQEQLDAVKKKYGFDQSLWTQYLFYLNDLSPISYHKKAKQHYTALSHGKYKPYVQLLDYGQGQLIVKLPYLRQSFTKQDKKVTQVLKETLPNTIVLATSAICIALILGIGLGILSALKQDHWIDRLILFVSTIGMSLPSFFSAILAAWFFGFLWHDFTGLEMTGNLFELDDLGESYHLHLENLILPAIVLGIRPLAVVSQLMRNALLEVLAQDYIKTARAKGLNTFKVIWNHALKNALSPVITAISGWFASMLAGAVFVEYVFGWNGLGKEIVNALNTLDLPIIMGSVLTIATIFVILNNIVDIVYMYLNPKIKLF